MDLKGLTGEIHVIPVLLMKKLRYSELKQLIQQHPTCQTPDVSGPIQFRVYRITIALIALVVFDENC